MSDFEKCMAFVFEREGGYANLANDEETNLGVRRSIYESYLGHPVKDKTFRNLTKEDVKPLYYEKYWLPSGAGAMDFPLSLFVFDFAVNSGVGRAVKELQSVLGVREDGVVGAQTLGAIRSQVGNQLEQRYLNARKTFLQSLPNFKLYGNGWLNRLQKLKEVLDASS